jgi:hypothetical protein
MYATRSSDCASLGNARYSLALVGRSVSPSADCVRTRISAHPRQMLTSCTPGSRRPAILPPSDNCIPQVGQVVPPTLDLPVAWTQIPDYPKSASRVSPDVNREASLKLRSALASFMFHAGLAPSCTSAIMGAGNRRQTQSSQKRQAQSKENKAASCAQG